MASRAEELRGLEHEWWARIPLVLRRPFAAFRLLRNDGDEAAQAAQEPIAALVVLSGIAVFVGFVTFGGYDSGFRSWNGLWYENDGALVIAVKLFFAGTLVGLQNYWIGGGVLQLGLRWMKAETRYRVARHLLALALTPTLLSLLVVFPIQLALFGHDLFAQGGSDDGAAADTLRGVNVALLAWAIGLALIGVRTVQGWSWRRAAGALGFALFLLALIGAGAFVL